MTIVINLDAIIWACLILMFAPVVSLILGNIFKSLKEALGNLWEFIKDAPGVIAWSLTKGRKS